MTRVISAPSIFVGIGAGLASALLFASLVGGSVLALPLFLVAPLPLAIAAFGWGTHAGLIAGIVTLGTVGFGLGAPAMVAATLADVVPTLLAAHLLGLARLTDPADPESPREWYPIGRAVLAVVIAVSIATIIGGIAIGFDVEETTAQVIGVYRQIMAESGTTPTRVPDTMQLEPFVHGTVRIMPAFFPASWVMVIVFDLWAAAKVVRKSGRLARPDEDLAALELPVAAGLACAATTALAFLLGGPLGLVAAVFAGSLFAAHLLVGFGILHTLARRSEARLIILAFAYGLVLLFTLPALLVALAGLVEPYMALRRRLSPPAGRT